MVLLCIRVPRLAECHELALLADSDMKSLAWGKGYPCVRACDKFSIVASWKVRKSDGRVDGQEQGCFADERGSPWAKQSLAAGDGNDIKSPLRGREGFDGAWHDLAGWSQLPLGVTVQSGVALAYMR